MRSATTRTLRGVMRRYRRDALAFMSSPLRYFGAGPAGAAGAGAPGAPPRAPGGPGGPGLALFSPGWAWEGWGGGDPPPLWPTLFSGPKTGVNMRPVCTAE